MQRKMVYGVLGLLTLVALAARWLGATRFSSTDIAPIPLRARIEGTPLCPWRNPDKDLHAFFPRATHHREEIVVLSNKMMELKERLGRWPTPEENPLRLNRIYEGRRLSGSILTRRVKGEHGTIELVLGVDARGQIRGLHVQRLREPEAVARVLCSPQWLDTFKGKTFDSNWRSTADIAAVVPQARVSARALADGVRSLMILLESAGYSSTTGTTPHH